MEATRRADPRIYQIAALALLLAFGLVRLRFDLPPAQAVVLIGTALAIRVRRGGLALSFGLAVFISFVYYAIIRTGQALGHSGTLPPIVGAWLGNIVFGGLGLELLRRARRGM